MLHIADKHGHVFTNKGWSLDEIKEFVLIASKDGLKTGKVVATNRPVYTVFYKGKAREIGITIGDNGYIVGAQSTSLTW